MIRSPPGQGRIRGDRIIRRPVQFDRVYSNTTGLVVKRIRLTFYLLLYTSLFWLLHTVFYTC
jgi:hypothetical protein